MSIEKMAEVYNVEPRMIRRFFRSDPAFAVIDPDRLTLETIEELQAIFKKWQGKTSSGRTVSAPSSTELPDIESRDDEVPMLPVTSLKWIHNRAHRRQVRDLTNQLDSWLETRLAEIGKSHAAKKFDPRWRTEYDIGRVDGRRGSWD